MPDGVIVDSAWLIGLSRIGKLAVLQQLFGKVLIPPAVFHEVVILGAGRAGAQEIKQAEWIETRPLINQLAVRAFRLNLGAGESEAIALAAECQAVFIILDDWKARQTALELALPVIGTVAVLKKATEKGIIEDFHAVLEELRQVGFRYLLM